VIVYAKTKAVFRADVLAESAQVAFDAGAKPTLPPIASVRDITTIPGDLFAKFQTGFYADPRDAAFKAMGAGRLCQKDHEEPRAARRNTTYDAFAGST
jgi:hypothetical protein